MSEHHHKNDDRQILRLLESVKVELDALKKETKRLADAVFQIEEFLLNPPSDKLEKSVMLFGATTKIKT